MPRGSQENWWVVTETEQARDALNAAIRTGPDGPPWGRAEVTIEGALGPPGHYGHLAAYDHEVHVTRVLSARPAPRP